MPITPYDEIIVQEDADNGQEALAVEEGKAGREGGALMPDAPAGLMILYTQKAVIITWDEIRDVRRYKVYRSIGDDYSFIGDTAAPAFTDRDVEPDNKYYYKITAVGILESQPSKEIEITTEVR